MSADRLLPRGRLFNPIDDDGPLDLDGAMFNAKEDVVVLADGAVYMACSGDAYRRNGLFQRERAQLMPLDDAVVLVDCYVGRFKERSGLAWSQFEHASEHERMGL